MEKQNSQQNVQGQSSVVFPDIYLKSDRDRLVSRLRKIKQEMFYTKTSWQKLVERYCSDEEIQTMENYCFPDKDIPNNIGLLSNKLDELINYLLERELVKLTIAAHLPKEKVKSMLNTICVQLGAHYIIDLHILPEVMGGAVIEYKGKRKDYSLLKQLDEIMSHPKVLGI